MMEDRRRYIRLNSCFPVEFSLYFTAQRPISQEYQGFTCNVSSGGLCIFVRRLREDDLRLILQKKVMLKLNINLPLFAKPAYATAAIAWSKLDEQDATGSTCLIGVSYRNITPEDRNRIIKYVRRLKWVPRLMASGLCVFLLSMMILSVVHIRAKNENLHLIKELVSTLEAKTELEERLKQTKSSTEILESKFLTSAKQIENLEGEITDIEVKTNSEKGRLTIDLDDAIAETIAPKTDDTKLAELQNKINAIQIELAEVTRKGGLQIESLQQMLYRLQEENNSLRLSIDLAKQGEVSLEEQFAQLKTKSGELEKANIEKIYGWLTTHQTKKTGLILSYEGDKSLQDYSFTYDQSLACQVFLIFGDIKRAKAILEFYLERAKTSEGLFYNAYDVTTYAAREYIVHTGPNIWIAIAACQYTEKTGDKRYLELARNIANKMIWMQRNSPDKSIKGGPSVEWVSTEHNLDAYALFNMLYKLTAQNVYDEAAQATFGWLKEIGYNRPEGRFMRGRGDSTIATDTLSWAIAAIGPDKLKTSGMNPDGIMEFAENECKVSTNFYRSNNSAVKVTGFDFAKAQHIGRGGVISTEWTAQMIVAFKLMVDYYKNKNDSEKEKIYRLKAEYYLSQLGKMVISSPSPTGQGESCLPYASIGDVDTGHGWRVAKGHRTGSVAATAYYIFAYKGYNPLSF